MALEKLVDPQPNDAIRAGTMNLTLVSGFVAAIGIILNAIPGVMDAIIGEAPTPGLRVAIFIAIIGALTVIVAADILARGYASAKKPDLHAVPLGQPVHAEREDIDDKASWSAVAVRETAPTNGDGKVGLEFLVTKPHHRPAWVPQEKLRLS
jgi:hypothetical protein